MNRLNLILIAALFCAGLATPSAAQAEDAWKRLAEITPAHAYPQRGRLQRAPEPDYEKQVVDLAALVKSARGTAVEPLAAFYKAHAEFELERFEDAIATLRDLKKRFPEHALCRGGVDASKKTLSSAVDDAIDDSTFELEIRKTYEVVRLPHAELSADAKAIVHTSLGSFEIQFYSNVAPKTVANFKKHIESGFYTGTYFHSVENFRTVSGGCPNTKEPNRDRGDDGKGGPGYSVPLELSDALHLPGAVSMRAMPDGKSAHGSQFTICVNAQPNLNNTHAVMGQVTHGMDVVRRIAQQRADDDGNPIDEVRIRGTEWTTAK